MIGRERMPSWPGRGARRVVLARWSPRRLWTSGRWVRFRRWRGRSGAARGTPAGWARTIQGTVVLLVLALGTVTASITAVPAAVRVVKEHPYFALRAIDITGNRRLERTEVLQWAGVEDGLSAWEAAPNIIRSRLLGHPWILDARVALEFPARLVIGIRERRPVAIVVADGLRYVDQHGRILGALSEGDSRDFPFITGLDRPEAAGFLDAGVHRALQALRWCERVRPFDGVSEVRVDPQRGVTVFPAGTAVAVSLGWGNWRSKLTRAARVLAAWEPQIERLASIDLSFRAQVVVRLKDEVPAPAVRETRRGMKV